ncbi:hypothetical protein [Novosphingobium sp. PhB165]|uniref:hypothetical protein n=1 Tax=Novosphingobium sp. PhB165 TaxID=2485105 RepID=UPI001053D178|nr:hypothetical protein [Novosphingobium sp. PhB165]
MSKDARIYSIDGGALPAQSDAKSLTNQLDEILGLLHAEFPEAAAITLDFNGKLHVHMDVRKGEDVPLLEERLSLLEEGMFTQVGRGATPGHPFSHRISALIAR